MVFSELVDHRTGPKLPVICICWEDIAALGFNQGAIWEKDLNSLEVHKLITQVEAGNFRTMLSTLGRVNHKLFSLYIPSSMLYFGCRIEEDWCWNWAHEYKITIIFVELSFF